MTVVTDGFGAVPSPPAVPPRVGLIASLSGTPYLDPDDRIGGFDQAPAEPIRPTPPPGQGAARVGLPAPPTPPQRWQAGFKYAPEQDCSGGGVDDPCNRTTLSIPSNQSSVAVQPFVVWAGDKCSTLGWSSRDFIGRATRALLACESKLIARELWKGTLSTTEGWNNPVLASPSADTLTTGFGPVTPAQALSLLEQGLADCGCGARGMIHATRQLVSAWSTLGTDAIRRENGLILTIMDTIVVPDAGYDGTGPNGEPNVAGSQWAYGTGMVTVRRSPVEVVPGSFEEAILAGTNSLEFLAQREAAASFSPCCHVAVNVNLPLALTGGAS